MPVSPVAVLYLAFVGLFVPYVAIKSKRALDGGMPMPARRKLFASILAQQAVMAGLALLVAWACWLDPFPRPSLRWRDFLAASALLAVSASTTPWRWRTAAPERRDRLRALLPTDRGERAWWVAVSLAAGVGEEVTYRGVTFLLLQQATGSTWAAALLSAGAFAAGHAIQGAASCLAIFALALGLQGLAVMSGGLHLAIAVHVLHDLFAGLWFARRLDLSDRGDGTSPAAGST